MSKFTDLMNQPLPSKMQEHTDDLDDMLDTNPTPEEDDETQDDTALTDNATSLVNDDDPINDDDDIDDLSDEDLASLDAELSDEALDAVMDDEEEVSLTPDEELRADDMMSMAATTMLVNDELNAEEKVSFLESEASIAIDEGFMTPSDRMTLMESTNAVITEANNYNKKMIIRLDAASKKKQLYALAVNVSASAHKDPDYIKLKKVNKMRKILRAKLARKYHGEATKRMKIYFNRLKNSKSKTLSNIAKKNSGK